LTIEELLARLSGVRRTRNGWMALCPAHDDHSPSLSITVRNETILLYCFGGCSYRRIVTALGLAPAQMPASRPPDLKLKVAAQALYAHYRKKRNQTLALWRRVEMERQQVRPDDPEAWDRLAALAELDPAPLLDFLDRCSPDLFIRYTLNPSDRSLLMEPADENGNGIRSARDFFPVLSRDPETLRKVLGRLRPRL
jgi:hypothetical protein